MNPAANAIATITAAAEGGFDSDLEIGRDVPAGGDGEILGRGMTTVIRPEGVAPLRIGAGDFFAGAPELLTCLLYTSDAADE